MDFKYYLEPFDAEQIPSPPPNITIREGSGETKESEQKYKEWGYRMIEYGRSLVDGVDMKLTKVDYFKLKNRLAELWSSGKTEDECIEQTEKEFNIWKGFCFAVLQLLKVKGNHRSEF